MAAGGLQLGLEVAFYGYPVGLFAALFASQIVAYRYSKKGKEGKKRVDEKVVEAVQRFYARAIWSVQLLLVRGCR